jgi:hypothetical protein
MARWSCCGAGSSRTGFAFIRSAIRRLRAPSKRTQRRSESHLVAHSLGGVLIRTMLEQGVPARLGRVVLLGSPLRGSRIGARAARLPGGRRLVGCGMLELNARRGFKEWLPAVPAGSIAGRLPFGAGWLLGGFSEPNDGTVAVSETQLPGLQDHVVLPVSHFALLWSKQVSEQARHFLLNGRFRREAFQAGTDAPA